MRLIIALICSILYLQGIAQHTFSIVAIDLVTGEVGGAGATCYETVNDIADVHPGIGFIHTQSYAHPTNQQYAKFLMDQGKSPQEIMTEMSKVVIDAENTPELRQYAAVDLLNGGRAASFTGQDCFDYKGQRVGSNYAIAGNILLGAQVLDSMEEKFLSTQGSLADKLMAALQGGKIQGADKRCIDSAVSSLSAYIIVAKSTDNAPNFYLNLNIEHVMPLDPIDVLQQDFDNWHAQSSLGFDSKKVEQERTIIFPNPINKRGPLYFSGQKFREITLTSTAGQTVKHSLKPNGYLSLMAINRGCYLLQINDEPPQKLIIK